MAKFGSGQGTPRSTRTDGLPGLGGPAGGRYDIRIARDGTWYHEGRPIRRPALVKLFATVLSRDESGAFWLTTPVERGRISVDDAPFVAVELSREGDGPGQTLWFRTNIDQRVAAGPEHPIRVAFSAGTQEPSPYILISQGLEALIVRPVYYRLADLVVDHAGRLGVWSRHRFFPLDAPADPSSPDSGDGP